MTPWTVTHQAPLSMGFSQQESWSEMPFLFPGDLPDPGIKPRFCELQADPLPSEPPGRPFIEKEYRLKSAEGRHAATKNFPSWSFQGSYPMESGHPTFLAMMCDTYMGCHQPGMFTGAFVSTVFMGTPITWTWLTLAVSARRKLSWNHVTLTLGQDVAMLPSNTKTVRLVIPSV